MQEDQGSNLARPDFFRKTTSLFFLTSVYNCIHVFIFVRCIISISVVNLWYSAIAVIHNELPFLCCTCIWDQINYIIIIIIIKTKNGYLCPHSRLHFPMLLWWPSWTNPSFQWNSFWAGRWKIRRYNLRNLADTIPGIPLLFWCRSQSFCKLVFPNRFPWSLSSWKVSEVGR